MVRADARLWPAVTEEALRWMSPLAMFPREAARTVRLGSTTLEPGARLGLLVAAARTATSVTGRMPTASTSRGRRAATSRSASGTTSASASWMARHQIGGAALPELFGHLPGLALDLDRSSRDPRLGVPRAHAPARELVAIGVLARTEPPTMATSAKPKSLTKQELVYDALRERILDWRVRARLPRRDRCARRRVLPCSTLPVREAIRRLEAEGLVVDRPNAGAQVAPADPEPVRGGDDRCSPSSRGSATAIARCPELPDAADIERNAG